MRPRPALFPLAAFARLRGLFGPGTPPSRRAGDSIISGDLAVATHGGSPAAWDGQRRVGRETRQEVTGGTEPDTSAQGVLAVHHLRKSYKARHVVEDVSMMVRRGEVVGLLGPNGAGKTTLFYMITGLIRPDSGQIELDGHDVTRLPMYRRARLGIGYLPQEASIFRGLDVEDNIK
ncbi:MAG: ATP-binding cassette domain-containing protein, partial [Methylocella sp.]